MTTFGQVGIYSPKKQQVLTTDNMYENREQNISNFLLAKDNLMLKILCAMFDQIPLLAYTKKKTQQCHTAAVLRNLKSVHICYS